MNKAHEEMFFSRKNAFRVPWYKTGKKLVDKK